MVEYWFQVADWVMMSGLSLRWVAMLWEWIEVDPENWTGGLVG